MIPKLARVAFLWNPQTSTQPSWKEIQLPAKALGLQLHSMEVSSADKIDSAFTAAKKAGSTALAVALGPLINSQQKRIVELAAKNRLPAIYSRADFVENGGLMSYGADQEGTVSAHRGDGRQDPQRRQARRSAGGAADEV